jgi:hypothetical protein
MTKIYLNNITKSDLETLWPLRVLTKNFKVEIAQDVEKSDLIIESITRGKTFIDSEKKVLFISSDNILFKKNLFSALESIIFRLGMTTKKYKIMDFLDKIIPKWLASMPLLKFFPKHERLIRSVSCGEVLNKYFILTNEICSKNTISIPVFLQVYYDKLPLLLKKKRIKTRDRFCAFVVSSNSSRERISLFKQLSKYKKIDSYGKVMNNANNELVGKEWINNYKLFSKYKFVLCFENSFNKDYITEKLTNVMLSGAIPIYRGAVNVGEYFNTKSFINFDDYGSYKKMISKIIELDNNPKEYKRMLSEPWFNENKIPNSIKNKKKNLIRFYEEILD